MKIVTINMELVIPDDDSFNTDSDDAICDYLNNKLYNLPHHLFLWVTPMSVRQSTKEQLIWT